MSGDEFLTKDEQVELLRSSVKDWNAYKRMHVEDRISLCDVDLSGVSLRGADLKYMRFICSDFSNSDAQDADFSFTDLSSANFTNALLDGARFYRSELYQAIFRDSRLICAEFLGARVSGSEFSGAIAGYTTFVDLDLSSATGVSNIFHNYPSSIGIDTLVKSGFDIPESFLEGCGVSCQLIDYLPAFKALPIQYYSCFISYSQKDEAFTKRLYEGLKSENIRVWYAPEEMKAGRTIYDQIDRAIRMHDKLLLVLSEASMNSQWGKTEIRKARKKEQQTGRRVLFPISIVNYEAVQCWECFDAGSGADMADDVREYYIPDFSNWKDHDAFQMEFKKLVAALQEGEEE